MTKAIKKTLLSSIFIASMILLSIGPSVNASLNPNQEYLSQDNGVEANQSIVPDFILDAIPLFNPNASSAEIAKSGQ